MEEISILNTTVIVDLNNLFMRCFTVQNPKEPIKDRYQMFRYMTLRAIFKMIDQFDADEIVLAIDGRKNWRRKIWKWYKVNRKIKRDSQSGKDPESTSYVNWEDFFKECDAFIESMREQFPFKIIRADETEADDIAGILSAWDKLANINKVLVSADGDFVQLLQCPNTRLYDAKNKHFVKSDDPKGSLLMKVILGDKKDYVWGIKEDHRWTKEFIHDFVDIKKKGKDEEELKRKMQDEDYRHRVMTDYTREYGLSASRCMGIGEQKAKVMLENGELKVMLDKDPELKRRFKRNMLLLDLTRQPQHIKEKIQSLYINYELPEKQNLAKYFMSHKFPQFLTDITSISIKMNKLRQVFESNSWK